MRREEISRSGTPLTPTSRSEGFPLTCYLIPVRDGAGAWTFGNLCLPPFKQEKDSDIIGLVRPAGGRQNSFKTN